MSDVKVNGNLDFQNAGTMKNVANGVNPQDVATVAQIGAPADGSVTLAKLADMATKTVIGRTSGGTGVPEAIPIATTLKTDLALVKADVGLSNVDNTSDANKPVSMAQATAIGLKVDKTTTINGYDLSANRNLTQDDIGDGTTNKQYSATDKAKVGHISITQDVDLDDIETRVNLLDAAVVLKGDWDASSGVFPGGGTAKNGWSYINSNLGEITIDGIKFNQFDRIVALVNNASTTVYSPNWLKLDYTDNVLSVAGKVGAVTLDKSDVSLGNVDNTSDTGKPVSTAQATAIGVVQSDVDAHEADTANPHAVTKTQVGLGNVDNTSDATKNSASVTLTNKRITRRTSNEASNATPSVNSDNIDLHRITALAAAMTSFTVTGTPTDGNFFQIAITDDGTARALAFGSNFEASGNVALPTTTVISTRMDLGFVWNTATSKWRIIALA